MADKPLLPHDDPSEPRISDGQKSRKRAALPIRFTFPKVNRIFLSGLMYIFLIFSCGIGSWVGYKSISFHIAPYQVEISLGVASKDKDPVLLEIHEDDIEIDLENTENKILMITDNVLSCRKVSKSGNNEIINPSPIKDEGDRHAFPNRKLYIINTTENTTDKYDRPKINCKLDSKKFHETFVDRSIVISRKGFGASLRDALLSFNRSVVGLNAVDVIFRSTESVVPNLSVSYEVELPGQYAVNPRRIENGGILKAKWVDESRKDIRDLILLAVGGLLGTLGATLLELLKLCLPEN